MEAMGNLKAYIGRPRRFARRAARRRHPEPPAGSRRRCRGAHRPRLPAAHRRARDDGEHDLALGGHAARPARTAAAAARRSLARAGRGRRAAALLHDRRGRSSAARDGRHRGRRHADPRRRGGLRVRERRQPRPRGLPGARTRSTSPAARATTSRSASVRTSAWARTSLGSSSRSCSRPWSVASRRFVSRCRSARSRSRSTDPTTASTASRWRGDHASITARTGPRASGRASASSPTPMPSTRTTTASCSSSARTDHPRRDRTCARGRARLPEPIPQAHRAP